MTSNKKHKNIFGNNLKIKTILSNLEVHAVAEILRSNAAMNLVQSDALNACPIGVETFYIEAREIIALIQAEDDLNRKMKIFKKYLGPQ